MNAHSLRNLELMIKELQESEDEIIRLCNPPTDPLFLKRLEEMHLFDQDVELLAHVIYPGLPMEYALYRGKSTNRVRMAFLR